MDPQPQRRSYTLDSTAVLYWYQNCNHFDPQMTHQVTHQVTGQVTAADISVSGEPENPTSDFVIESSWCHFINFKPQSFYRMFVLFLFFWDSATSVIGGQGLIFDVIQMSFIVSVWCRRGFRWRTLHTPTSRNWEASLTQLSHARWDEKQRDHTSLHQFPSRTCKGHCRSAISPVCLLLTCLSLSLPVCLQKFRRRVQESTQMLRELEISLRTNHIGYPSAWPPVCLPDHLSVWPSVSV